MRYLVVGTSGAGKSTFAAKLAAAVQCPCIELDAHYGVRAGRRCQPSSSGAR